MNLDVKYVGENLMATIGSLPEHHLNKGKLILWTSGYSVEIFLELQSNHLCSLRIHVNCDHRHPKFTTR